MRELVFAVLCFFAAAAIAQQKAETRPELPYVPGKRWAIVVGAAGYEHFGKLNYADDDAEAIANALIEEFRFEPETVKLLTDKPDSKLKPTAGNIIGEIEDALANETLTKSDMFVFFFAGHGVGTDKGDYLLPTDARQSTVERVGLPVSEIISRFSKAGLKNVLIIVDACRSGKANPFGKQLQQLGREAKISVMLGCAPGARSYEDQTLRHGVFAHHFLQALRDKTLRDPISGALWASSIGEWIKKQVRDYTERDYGDDAQVPYVWSDKTSDVLIGAYLPSDIDANNVAAFTDKARELGTASYAAAMSTYASGLFEKGRFEECISVLKTLESLGALEPDALYMLGTALTLTDRTGEASKCFEELEKSASVYWKNMAICANTNAPVSEEKRVNAAKSLWQADKTWTTGYIAWSVIMVRGTHAEQQEFLKDFLKLPSLSNRRKLYLQASLKSLQGDSAGALADLRSAAKEKGDEPNALLLSMLMLPLLADLGKMEEMDALIDAQIKSPERTAYWLLLKATREKARGTANWMQYVQQALGSNPTPDELMQSIKIAGMQIGAIRDALRAQADKYPYSWKALASKILCVKMDPKDPSWFIDALDESERFAENKLLCRTAIMEMMRPMMEETVNAGGIPPQQYVSWLDASWSMLYDYRDQLLQNYDSWWMIAEYGAMSERFWQSALLVKKLLASNIEAGAIKPNLALVLMLVFMNVGDAPMVEKLYKIVLKGGDPQLDGRALYAVFLASQGKFAEADAVFKGLSPESSDEFMAIASWLDAGMGRAKEAREKLAKVKESQGFIGGMCGLAYSLLKDWEKAEPLLVQSRQNRSWGFICVSAAAFQVLWNHYREKNDTESLNALGFEAGLSQPGNPLYMKTGFAETPNLDVFDGKYTWSVGGHDEDYVYFDNATLTLSITKGAVEGSMEINDGKVMRLTGTIDAYGNVNLQAKSEGVTQTCLAKIAPHAIYDKYSGLQTIGQVFLLFNSEAGRTVWVAKPKVATSH